MSRSPRVGVLSLQGDFECHRATLAALGATPVRVTLPRDLAELDALILPGGESTTMSRLLDATGLREPLAGVVRTRPVLGTCAGLILLARDASLLPGPTFGALDVSVERNAYGRQIDSFTAPVESAVFEGPAHGVFIRAPRIRRVGEGVEVVARLGREPAGHGRPARPEDAAASSREHVPGEPVGVRAGHVVGLCFHPELTRDLRFHRWFLTRVAGLELPGVPEPSVEGSVAREWRA